jgi:hypothetical protein
MVNLSDERIATACRKLIEFKDLLRQNFAPAPESVGVYNECIDLLIAAGLPAVHYKADRDITPLEFRGRLETVLQELCQSARTTSNNPRE